LLGGIVGWSPDSFIPFIPCSHRVRHLILYSVLVSAIAGWSPDSIVPTGFVA
jgi:hypothetical protein